MASPIELSQEQLEEILQFSIKTAREAGALIVKGSAAILANAGTTSDEKKNSVDLVTEYDVAVEKLVQEKLQAKYPSFGFIGEESYSAGTRPPLTDEPTFCVDPIDGTTNFVHGFPFVCHSLGLIYKKSPIIGVIYNPFLDHLYYGLTGHGSFLQRGISTEPQKLPLSANKPLKTLGEALIAVEWGSQRDKTAIERKSLSFARLAADPTTGFEKAKMAHSLRTVGSGALNCALVAQGALDMYWEIGCWPWDVCAGTVIVQEAGGVVVGSKATIEESIKADFKVAEKVLTGRKYLMIRSVAGGKADQARIARDFYETVEDVELDD